MLTSLKSMPADNDDGNLIIVDDDDLAQGIVTKGNSRPGVDGSNPFQQLNRFHRNLKPSRGEYLASLHDKEKFEACADSEAVKLLENVGTEQDFVVTFVDVEEKSKDDKFHCFVQLSTTPVAVCYGVGMTEEEARVESARKALEYLRIMTIP
jgi:Staufen C-terminal domain